jgi:enamine deaminase RidA (YjgF/YER057c/UK114 family)
MTSQIEKNLEELNIKIPQVSAPAANYAPFVQTGNQVFISGQLPIEDGQIKYTGKVGAEISIEDGKKAAAICAINIIANLKNACGGNLDKVVKCVKLGIFVNAHPDFTDHPVVGNGASDLIVSVFGDDKGKHARFAMGAGSLPKGVSVEIDAVFEIEE